MTPNRPCSDGPEYATSSASYSAEDVIRFRETFGPIAERYHRHRRIAWGAGGTGFCVVICLLLSNGISMLLFDKTLYAKDPPWYVTVIVVTCFVVFAGAMISRPRLKCPGCGGFLTKGIGRYCPECGSEGLETDWLGRPCCRGCGNTMARGRYGGRLYRVRACTFCGLMLDSRGF